MIITLVVAIMAIASFKTAKAAEECKINEITCYRIYYYGGSLYITTCNGCYEVNNVSEASDEWCCEP